MICDFPVAHHISLETPLKPVPKTLSKPLEMHCNNLRCSWSILIWSQKHLNFTGTLNSSGIPLKCAWNLLKCSETTLKLSQRPDFGRRPPWKPLKCFWSPLDSSQHFWDPLKLPLIKSKIIWNSLKCSWNLYEIPSNIPETSIFPLKRTLIFLKRPAALLRSLSYPLKRAWKHPKCPETPSLRPLSLFMQ